MVVYNTKRARIAIIKWRGAPRHGFVTLPADVLLDAGLVIGGGLRVYSLRDLFFRGPQIRIQVDNWDGTDVGVPKSPEWSWARARGTFVLFITPRSTAYYASDSVSSGGSGTSLSPWSLRRALDGTQSPSPGAGDTLYIKGGTYYGGFTCSLNGAPGNPVQIRPAPGEQYHIEQYVYGILTSAINSSTNNVPWTPAAGISLGDMTVGDEFVINAAGGRGVAEACRVLSGPFTGGPSNHQSLRGLNGTTAQAHSAGELIYGSNNGFYVTGDYQQWWFCDPNVNPHLLSTVRCSNPIRSFPLGLTVGDAAPWQRSKAGFSASNRTGLEIHGALIRDSNDGIFITGTGGGHQVTALLAYNNGHVDDVRGHGQPLYVETEAGAEFQDVISFNNFGSGSKFYAVTAAISDCFARRVYSFNNAAPASYTGTPGPFSSTRYVEGNFFIGTDAGPMSDCGIVDSVCWHPYDAVCTFPHVQFGYGNLCTDSIVDNNWIIGGDQMLLIDRQAGAFQFSRNIFAQNTISAPQSDDNFKVDTAASQLATWQWGTGGNINQYWAKNRLLGSDSFTYPFLTTKDGTTGSNEFGGTGHQRYDVPSDTRDFLGFLGLVLDYHDQALPSGTSGFSFRTALCIKIPTRSHIACVKWDGTNMGTFTVPASAFTAAGFTTGDGYRIYNALNYEGDSPLTGTFSGSGISIASGSFSRANPVGFTTEVWRGNTWTMGFGVLIVYRIPSGGGGDTTPPTVAMTAPAPAATVSGTVSVTANASDNVGVVGVQFKLDGSNLGAEDTTAPYAITWNTTLVADGSHTLTAVARDAAGNSTTSTGVTVTVANAVGDTTPPTVSITAPSPGATVSGTAVNLIADAADNVGVAGVQFKLNGSSINPEELFAPYSTLWNSTAVADGTYTLTAVARDAAGNTTTAAPISITVDNVAVPVLSSIAPPSGTVGTTVGVVLTGANFALGATTVAVSGSGVTVSGVSIPSTTSLTATFTLAIGAATGPRTVTVTTLGGTSNPVTFTVNPAAPVVPTLASISPSSATVGTAPTVTLTGTGFVVGATTVQINGSGVTISGVSVSSATSLTATFTISSGAATGARSVTVTTTPGGTSNSIPFTVNPVVTLPPTISSISPNSGTVGTVVPVTLTGTNFVSGSTTVAVSGTGVTVSGVNVTSTTSLGATFTINAAAAIGARTVTVTVTPGGSATINFTLAPVATPPPSLTAISPTVGFTGSVVSVTLTGTNFVTGSSTVNISGTGVNVGAVNVVNATSITALFTITAGAAVGVRNVNVTVTGRGTSGSVTFTVIDATAARGSGQQSMLSVF